MSYKRICSVCGCELDATERDPCEACQVQRMIEKKKENEKQEEQQKELIPA